MEIVALSETRLFGEGHDIKSASGCTFCWSGKKKQGLQNEVCFGFAIKSSPVDRFDQLSCSVSDHLFSLDQEPY